MRQLFLLLCFLIHFAWYAKSQDSSFNSYKYDKPFSELKFSMMIPTSWVNLVENDGDGFFENFLETNYATGNKLQSCLDSSIYRLKSVSGDLRHAMNELGFSERGDKMYVKEINGVISVVVGFEIRTNNYTGLKCSFKTNALCLDGKVKKSAAEMEYLLFSNGKKTVCLINNGIATTERIINTITESFKFD